MLGFSSNELVALVVAISFAAGLNVYATIASLGLLANLHLVPLPPQLLLLGNWWIIGAALILFLIEFFADKVPIFDLVWNAVHTFVRVPVAALLAYAATSHLAPGKQVMATFLGGVIALIAHGGKIAARTAVSTSPEPISNIGLSFGEDIGAIFLTWFGTRHPYGAAVIVVALLVGIFLFIRTVIRQVRKFYRMAVDAIGSPR